MDSEGMEFAIVIEKTSAVIAQAFATDEKAQKVELFRGTTVQIKREQHFYSICMICDLHKTNLAFQNNLYHVKTSALVHVDESIWLQLVAIPDQQERANIAKDKSYIDFIASLKLDTFVGVNAHHFSMCPIRESLQFLPERELKDSRDRDFDCIIRYIGFVNEIGPGYYYGLELLVIYRSLAINTTFW